MLVHTSSSQLAQSSLLQQGRPFKADSLTFDPMNATDSTDVTEAQPLWMGVLGVCLGITGSFFSTLSLLIIKCAQFSARNG